MHVGKIRISKLDIDRFEMGGEGPEGVEARSGRRQRGGAAAVPLDLESVLVARISLPGGQENQAGHTVTYTSCGLGEQSG